MRSAASAASQTAWAVLGLMAAGGRTIRPLPAASTGWSSGRAGRAAAGGDLYRHRLPARVLPAGYHGYAKFFPLWAVSRYRNLMEGNGAAVLHGICDRRGIDVGCAASPPRVIALCGMRAEARLAGGPGVLAVGGGGRAGLAPARLTAALAEGGAAGASAASATPAASIRRWRRARRCSPMGSPARRGRRRQIAPGSPPWRRPRPRALGRRRG